MPIRQSIKKFIGKVKEDAFYYKVGKKVERAEIRKKRVESNIASVRRANPEMADRMQAEYEEYKKKGVY